MRRNDAQVRGRVTEVIDAGKQVKYYEYDQADLFKGLH